MCSSDVMLRINSSESSGLITGPSTRCKMPCTRMVGGAPTRICRSDAPSATTNCNKSDIEYDIKIQMQVAECRMKKLAPPVESGFNSSFFIFHSSFPLRLIAERRADDLLSRREPGEHLADAVLAQGAHAHFAGARAQNRGGRLVVNQLPRFIVNDEYFKDAEAAAVTGVRAIVAAAALPERVALQLVRGQVQGAHFRVRGLIRLRALFADSAHQPLRHEAARGRRDQEGLHANVHETRDGARRVIRVQRGENQVTGERRVDGNGRGF